MLREVLLLNLILCPWVMTKRRHHKRKESSSGELGGDFITSLRNDANLDLSMDEEYEDLRAELLAYHTALSSLTGLRAEGVPGALPPEVAAAVVAEPGNGINSAEAAMATPSGDTFNLRRSMKSTPCWQLGGICINHKLCEGHRFLTEVPGCKDKLEVCCFSWNKYKVKDLTDKGISNLNLPWSNYREFGGKGLIGPYDRENTSEETDPGYTNVDSGDIRYLSSTEHRKKNTFATKTKKENPRLNSRKQKKPIVIVLKSDKK